MRTFGLQPWKCRGCKTVVYSRPRVGPGRCPKCNGNRFTKIARQRHEPTKRE